MISTWRLPVFTCLALSLAATACTQVGPSGSPGPALPPTPVAAKPPSDSYVIGAGDTLSVFVYHSPELSLASTPVRPDGRISVPLIEDIEAAGKTPTQLARDIEARLKKYVQDPNVTVIVNSFVGPFDRQIRVIGEATDPQAIPYRDHMTVLDVMIATKGLTKYAAGNRALLIRKEPDGKDKTINLKLDDLLKNGDISQNVEMQPGDTIIIPETYF